MNSGSIRGLRSTLIFLLDISAIGAIFSGVYYRRFGEFPDLWSPELWTITATFVLVLFLAGTYFRHRSTNLPQLPVRTFFVCLVAGTICVLWLYLLGPAKFNQYFGRGVLPVGTLLCGVATTFIRFFVNRFYHRQEQDSELLYLGYSQGCKAFLSELKNHAEVQSVTIASQGDIGESSNRVTQSTASLVETLALANWQTIIVDPAHEPEDNETSALVNQRLAGTPVLSLADFYEKYWYMVPVHNIGDDWFLRSQGFSMLDNLISKRIKRIVDIALSLFLLVITSPIMVVCGIIIKLTSKGPAFFKQTRVGLGGEHFTIVKLRTMRSDAEVEGAQWAQKDDPRITGFGKFLRQTRLDELPQCWNVLQGSMSFVGPRPERPEFTHDLAEKIPYYELRHLVKPGITGWAQVIFPYGASIDDSLKKLQYELYYIKNQTLLLDLNIMLRTLITVFQRAGR